MTVANIPGWTDITPGEFDRSGNKIQVIQGPKPGTYTFGSTADAREIEQSLKQGLRYIEKDSGGEFGITVPGATEPSQIREAYPGTYTP
ncbi:MAG: hypothetical protein AAF533_11765 [Acidobacteriota bacterium]